MIVRLTVTSSSLKMGGVKGYNSCIVQIKAESLYYIFKI